MNIRTKAVGRVVGAAAAALAILGIPAAATAMPAAASAAPAAAPRAGVPKNFVANSITWLSPTRGWVLGTTSCGGKFTNCPGSIVIGTADGGTTWHLIGKLSPSIPKGGNPVAGQAVTEIRMVTPSVGWVFGPGLYHTANGGRTWQRMSIPAGAKQVLDLAVSSTGAAYAIVSQCAYMTGLCGKPLTAWRTNLAGTAWTRMPARLHGNVAADVSAFGKTVYLVNPFLNNSFPSQFYASADGGRSFAARPVPCPAIEIHTLIQAVPYSAVKVALLCDGNAGFGKSVKSVYLSANTGKTDKYAGTMSPWGIQAQLTVSPTGNMAVATWSIGSFIDINDGRGTAWQQVIGSGDGGAGFNDITYVSANVAWVVGSPADMFPGFGKLLVTRDAGRHWAFAKV